MPGAVDVDPGGWSGWQDIEAPPAVEDALEVADTGEGSDGDQDALPDQGAEGSLELGGHLASRAAILSGAGSSAHHNNPSTSTSYRIGTTWPG